MLIRSLAAAALCGGMALIGAPATAQDEVTSDTAADGFWVALEPQVSLRAGVWSHDREIGEPGSVFASAIQVRIAPRLSDKMDAFAEGRAQADTNGGDEADLREGWIRYIEGPFRATAGRQIVVWGRADGLNPSDVLSSRDYTRLLGSDEDQRRGAATATVSYGSGPWTLTGAWLPEFRPNIFPMERSLPGIAILDDQDVHDKDQFAAKIDRAGGAIDWSVSYFHGTDRTRDIVALSPPVGSSPGVFVAIQQQYPKVRVLGADLAGVAGGFGFRAEAALTDVQGPATPYRKNDSFWIVAGGDHTFDNGWNLNVQYSFRYIFDFQDLYMIPNPVERQVALTSAAVNNQLDKRQSGVTLRVAQSWRNDTLAFEGSVVTFFETGDIAIRPRLNYAINDQLRAIVGGDLFRGPRLSYFGRVRDVSAVYVQLIHGF